MLKKWTLIISLGKHHLLAMNFINVGVQLRPCVVCIYQRCCFLDCSLSQILAAHRYGIKRVILPEKNMKDLVEVPAAVLGSLEVILSV